MVGERDHLKPVEHVVRVQPLAVDCDRVRRRGDQRLQLVGQGAALLRLRLLQLVQDDDFGFQRIAPLAFQPACLDDRHIVMVLAANGPQERRPHRVLAAAFVAAVQYGMIDLDVRVLGLERHDVENVVQLCFIGDQYPAVGQPSLDAGVADRRGL